MNDEMEEIKVNPTISVGIVTTAYKEYEVGADGKRVEALAEAMKTAGEELTELGYKVIYMTVTDNAISGMIERLEGEDEDDDEPKESNLDDEVNDIKEWLKQKEEK